MALLEIIMLLNTRDIPIMLKNPEGPLIYHSNPPEMYKFLEDS